VGSREWGVVVPVPFDKLRERASAAEPVEAVEAVEATILLFSLFPFIFSFAILA